MYPDHNPAIPPIPTVMSEAHQLAEETHKMLASVWAVLYLNGLTDNPTIEKWEPLFDDENLFRKIHTMACDIQLIKEILLAHGLADDKTLVEMSPRWRLDAGLHHKRNACIFAQYLYSFKVANPETIDDIVSWLNGVGKEVTREEFIELNKSERELRKEGKI